MHACVLVNMRTKRAGVHLSHASTWGKSKMAEGNLGQFPSMTEMRMIFSLFMKDSTALTRSTVVERNFSTEAGPQTQARYMTCKRFEKLVFTRGNMQVLDGVLRRQRERERLMSNKFWIKLPVTVSVQLNPLLRGVNVLYY